MRQAETQSDAAPPARLLRPASWPLRIRMALDLVLAALVPLSIALWIALSESRDRLDDAAHDHLRVLAHCAADHLDRMIGETSRAAARLALDQQIIELCLEPDRAPDAAAHELRSVVSTHPEFASAFVVGRDAVGLASTNPRNVGQDLAYRQYVNRALAGEAFTSPFVVGKTTGDAGVHCSAPVRAADSIDAPVVGAAVVELSGEGVWAYLASLALPPQSVAALVDHNGVVIAHPRRDVLFHSLGALTPEQITEIDPMLTYSVDSIPSLGLDHLTSVASDDSHEGSVTFEIPEEIDDHMSSRMRVAGYAALQTRPWKVFIVQEQGHADAAAATLIRHQVAIAAVVSLAAIGLAILRARTIVRPILDLSRAAEQLGRGDFSARARTYSDDEVGRLASTFNEMVPQLQNAVALQKSLEVAMEVQQSLLPAADPTFPRLDVAGRTRYCDETGGDYYDFLDIGAADEGAAFIAVGDVMGHGIGAALLMASARAALHARIPSDTSLADMLNRVNVVLVNERDNRFMTLALLIIDPDRPYVQWASAGHDPPIVFRPREDRFFELDGGGIPLGIDPGFTYEDYSTTDLAPGDIIVVGTDGIWEAPNPSKEMFGKDRLRNVVRAHADADARTLAGAIQREVDEFRGAAAQNDDITFVVIRVRER